MYREFPYNFGALPPLPDGYSVVYRESHEHYQAIGPEGWEGDISVDPYWCRRQAIWNYDHRIQPLAVGMTRTAATDGPIPRGPTV